MCDAECTPPTVATVDKRRASHRLGRLLAVLAGLVVVAACSLVLCCSMSSPADGSNPSVGSAGSAPHAHAVQDSTWAGLGLRSVDAAAGAAFADPMSASRHGVSLADERAILACSHAFRDGVFAVLTAVMLLVLTRIRRHALADGRDVRANWRGRHYTRCSSLATSVRLAQLCVLRT